MNHVRIQLEAPLQMGSQSFGLMFNPRLNDLFYWHFHPEYELVYIEAESGPRQIGAHSSRYSGSDLVLIGSNIPHLNFDYGVRGSYRKVVVHLQKELIENQWAILPELASMSRLFQKSAKGLAFHGRQKLITGNRLFALEGLNPARQYLELMDILLELADCVQSETLHEQPYYNQYTEREQNRIKAIFAFIDENYHRNINLQEISSRCHLSREAFCRYFKKMTNASFTEFLNRYRISQSKNMLMTGYSVTDACYASGFGSLSYFNRIFRRVAGENPSEFRQRFE
jgi:AraC-like DNA-binding protein